MSDEPPLLPVLRAIIADEGPLGVDRFMALALGHPRHGYYMTRDPLGPRGDFTTAPEISQMFGEMIGLWCVAVFAAMGSPAAFILAELGPGRGTLMADLLRAASIVPAFGAATAVHLVETSPVLRARQAETLGATGVEPHWHATMETVPDGPLLLVANEFFDALPVRQYRRGAAGWHERLVGLDAGDGLTFGLAGAPEPALTLPAPEGTMLEVGFAAGALAAALAGRLTTQGGAALVVDYGATAPRFGTSLQAVRGHASADPLSAPGETDLTAHVDFSALARAASGEGAIVHGPVAQGAFLHDLGIAARAERLSRGRPEAATKIADALARLTAPAPGMGDLFKVMALTSPDLPVPPGFGAV